MGGILDVLTEGIPELLTGQILDVLTGRNSVVIVLEVIAIDVMAETLEVVPAGTHVTATEALVEAAMERLAISSEVSGAVTVKIAPVSMIVTMIVDRELVVMLTHAFFLFGFVVVLPCQPFSFFRWCIGGLQE